MDFSNMEVTIDHIADAGAKTCGLNALAHNLYIARIAQGQNQVLGEFPIHIVFAHKNSVPTYETT